MVGAKCDKSSRNGARTRVEQLYILHSCLASGTAVCAKRSDFVHVPPEAGENAMSRARPEDNGNRAVAKPTDARTMAREYNHLNVYVLPK